MENMTENLVHEGINVLLKSRYFGSKDELLDEAVRTLLEVKPALKTEIAVELYKKGTVSLSRASEIAGVSTVNTIFHQWMKLLYHLLKPMA